MLPKITIASGGRRVSGKDEFLERMKARVERRGIKCCIVPFGSVLKHEIAKDKDLDYDRLMNDRPYKEANRSLLIDYGRERRAENVYCFIDGVYNYCDAPCLLIPDIRQKEEFQRMGDAGAFRFLITATEEVRKARGWVYDPKIDEDPTEKTAETLKGWTAIVENNGTLEELDATCDKLCDEFIVPKLRDLGLIPCN